MTKSKFAEQSTEYLVKREKHLKAITYMLAATLLILLLLNIYNGMNNGFTARTAIPVVFLPLLILNFNNLKEIKKEIASRKSDA